MINLKGGGYCAYHQDEGFDLRTIHPTSWKKASEKLRHLQGYRKLLPSFLGQEINGWRIVRVVISLDKEFGGDDE